MENGEAEIEIPEDLNAEFFDGVINTGNQVIKTLRTNQDEINVQSVKNLLLVMRLLREDLLQKNQEISELRSSEALTKENLKEVLEKSIKNDEITMNLKESVENAWKQVDAAQERETYAQQEVAQLRARLHKMDLEFKALYMHKEEPNFEGFTKPKHQESILKERDRLNAENEELTRRLQVQRMYAEEIEKKRTEFEEKNKQLYKLLEDISEQSLSGKKHLQAVKKELLEALEEKRIVTEEARMYKSQKETCIRQNADSSAQIMDLKQKLDRMTTKFNLTTYKLGRTVAELNRIINIRNNLQLTLNKKKMFLKLKEDESKKLYAENDKLTKSVDAYMRKLIVVDEGRGKALNDVQNLKNTLEISEKEILAGKLEIQNLDKELNWRTKERDTVRSDLATANLFIEEQKLSIEDLMRQLKGVKQDLKQTIDKYKRMIRETTTKLTTEKRKLEEDLGLLEKKVADLNSDLNLKNKYIADLKDDLAKKEARVVELSASFETCRKERNQFQKGLQNCEMEGKSMKEKVDILTSQNKHLGTMLALRDQEVHHLTKTVDKCNKDILNLQTEVTNMKVTIHNLRTEIKEKSAENLRLYDSLQNTERALKGKIKELEATNFSKNLTESQLIRRNDEVGLLKEKMSIVQAALDRGEAWYSKRLEDIRLLKMSITNLDKKNGVLKQNIEKSFNIRGEVLQLHRMLNQERVKNRALEEEMMTPANIHRWRALGGTDPEKLELIEKIRYLQHQLIFQTAEVNKHKGNFIKMEKMYQMLKEFMEKLPSFKIQEKLNKTQKILLVRNKKLKALTAELNIYTHDDKSKDCSLVELQMKLEETAKQLYNERKQKQKLLEEKSIMGQMTRLDSNVSGTQTFSRSSFKISYGSFAR